MRGTSMGIRLCVLVVFMTSVCQGAAVPSQRLDCVTSALYNGYIETGSTFRQSREPCATGYQFSERRKRQVEVVQPVDVQPVDTSTQPTSTEAQAQVENSTPAVLTSSSAAVSPPEIVPSLPPPPHPSAAHATAVKPRSCKSGSTWEEECNTCWCLDNGMAACTVKRCEVISPVAAAKSTTAVAPAPTEGAPIQTSTPAESPAPSEQPTTPSGQSSTTSETTSAASQTTSVKESSSTSPTTSVQASSTSSGGTS